MSISSLQSEWTKTFTPIVHGRASAKGALIARHNYKGEMVFQARRKWQSSRAGYDAAHRRLEAAMAELDAARRGEEEAELVALRAMGIGVNMLAAKVVQRPACRTFAHRRGCHVGSIKGSHLLPIASIGGDHLPVVSTINVFKIRRGVVPPP